MEKIERINKYLGEAGVCARRDVDDLIRCGRVEVNGELARVGMRIDTERDQVTVDGQIVDPAHPEKNAIDPDALAEQRKQPWWIERNARREADREEKMLNPKSRLLRKGAKQHPRLINTKTLVKSSKPSPSRAERDARRAEGRKAKTFSEALSDKQKLMNVKTRKVEHTVNPKSAALRGKRTGRRGK